MRLCMFDKSGNPTLGARSGDRLIDLSVAAPGLPGSIVGIIESGSDGLRRLGDAIDGAQDDSHVDSGSVRYHLPIAHKNTVELTANWIAGYEKRRPSVPVAEAGVDPDAEPIPDPVGNTSPSASDVAFPDACSTIWTSVCGRD